jgi:hypothetical protein
LFSSESLKLGRHRKATVTSPRRCRSAKQIPRSNVAGLDRPEFDGDLQLGQIDLTNRSPATAVNLMPVDLSSQTKQNRIQLKLFACGKAIMKKCHLFDWWK